MHLKQSHTHLKPIKAAFMRLSAAMMAALLILTLFPAGTYAAGTTISPDTINESGITGGSAITITLDSNAWALGSGSAKTAKCNALVDAMYADSGTDELNKIKNALRNNPDAFTASGNTLTITLPTVGGYDITYDQNITVNIPSSLLVDSSNPVSNPPVLTVKAEPETILSGTATSANEADITRGGRKLSITLNGGTWDDVVNNTANREALLDCLTASPQSEEWVKVINTLKAAEPGATISLSDDSKTVTITLPAVPVYNISAAQTVTLNTASLASLVTVGGALKDSQPSFTIEPSNSTVQLSGTIISAAEGDIKAGGKTMIISLTDNAWAADIEFNQTKINALFSGMTAKNEQSQWTKVTNALKSSGNVSLSDDNKTITVTLPAISGYDIASDQTIMIDIPSALLINSYNLNTLTFTVTADKAVSVSGTILSADETAIAAGGKTIILTLTNAKWAGDIATSLTRREALIDKFTSYDPAWQYVKETLKASGTFRRGSDSNLTITLPPVPTFNIASDLTVDLSGISADESLVYDSAGTAVAVSGLTNALTIKAVAGQTATISGAILSKTSELDIVRGGRNITVTLKGDAWSPDIESQSAQFLSCFEAVSGSGADKAEWDDAISEADVTLVNSTTIDVKLPAIPDFDINGDINVQLTIDDYLLSAADMPISASPLFTIYATTVDLSGTALTGNFDASAVEKGGKTIIITLNNGIWIPNVISDSANLAALLNGFDGEAWEPIEEVLQQNPRNISIRGNQITIKLPAVPGYNKSGTISLTIPKELIAGSNSDISASSDINIGDAASADISPDILLESDIIYGDAVIEIKLTSNKWSSDMISNKQKANTLINGFSPISQADSWKNVQAAVTALNPSDLITLSADKTVLTLKLPAVADYDITQDQQLSVIISKALLASADADINAGSITIESTKPFGTAELNTALNDGTLASWLDGISPNDIYIMVPQKRIYAIDIAHILLGSSYLTDITVTTDNKVAAVTIETGNTERTLSSYKVSGDKRIFNAGFANLSQGADVSISAEDNSGNILQEGIVKKIAIGINTYNEMPKTDLSGSYSLHNFLIDNKLLNSILQYYRLSDLSVGIS